MHSITSQTIPYTQNIFITVALKYILATHTKWITQISIDEKGNKSLIHNNNIIPFKSSSETETSTETSTEKEEKWFWRNR